MSIRTLIVEDEKPARDLIRSFLMQDTDIEIIGECDNGFEAVKVINEQTPDLVMLDVQLPKLTGFEILELIEHKPLIIFSTAYDQYAIKAFELSAIDYLLKPYSEDRFFSALSKAKAKQVSLEDKSKEISKVLDAAIGGADFLQRIAVKNKQKITVLPIKDVKYLKSDGDYVLIHTVDGRFMKEKTMKYFEAHLNPGEFIRVHRTAIINVSFVDKIELYEKEKYLLVLKGGEKINVSSNGYKLLKKVLKL